MNKSKIFLSYAHEDIEMAKKIYADLKRYDLNIWFDNESLLGGQNWKHEISKAIQGSEYFLAIISSSSVDKVGYIQNELKLALEILANHPKSKIYMLPVRIEDCTPVDFELHDLHWINLFPDNEYEKGLEKILKVVSPGTFVIRNEPTKLSSDDVHEMLRRHGYYECDRNPEGKGISHNYSEQELNGDKIIYDESTNLMWQQGGSSKYIKYEKVKKWIEELNSKGYAGYKDWRLPTLEEAMSLMEPEARNGMYIDPLFDIKQDWIWTSDLYKGGRSAWVVYFGDGGCGFNLIIYNSHVRLVRPG